MGAYSFTDNAIRDLDSICDLIAIDNPDAVSNLFDDIREQCMRVGFRLVAINMAKSSRICVILSSKATLYFIWSKVKIS